MDPPPVSKAIKNLLGNTLLSSPSPEDQVAVEDVLGGKIVGIYFSAWWCNPCRIFTPKLIHAYSNILMNEKFDFEIVFASSDQDQAEFDRYFSEMPWLALPFGDDRKTKLKHRFKVANIPTLVLLDPSGRLITKEARDAIADDPDAFGFPWNPKPFWALMGQTVIDGAGRLVPTSRLRGKYLGIYFSADWCPPCRAFTPTLITVYQKVKLRMLMLLSSTPATSSSSPFLSSSYSSPSSAHSLLSGGYPSGDFEIILASSDQDKDSFSREYASMPWLAFPFNDEREAQLSLLFGVEGLPCLVIVGPDGKIINKNARASISLDLEGVDFPWPPPPFSELTSSTTDFFNEQACCVLFLTGLSTEDRTRLLSIFSEVAARYRRKFDDNNFEDKLAFLYALDHPVVSRVREYAQIGYPSASASSSSSSCSSYSSSSSTPLTTSTPNTSSTYSSSLATPSYSASTSTSSSFSTSPSFSSPSSSLSTSTSSSFSTSPSPTVAFTPPPISTDTISPIHSPTPLPSDPIPTPSSPFPSHEISSSSGTSESSSSSSSSISSSSTPLVPPPPPAVPALVILDMLDNAKYVFSLSPPGDGRVPDIDSLTISSFARFLKDYETQNLEKHPLPDKTNDD